MSELYGIQARKVVDETLEMWATLLNEIESDERRDELKRSNGMRMEQLRVESDNLFQKLVDH